MSSNINGGKLTSIVYSDTNCSSPLHNFTSQIGGSCNSLADVPTGFPQYYDVNIIEVPVEFYGQVNLNQPASDLNAQIVGSSVGVICGVTALIVIISIFGVLG